MNDDLKRRILAELAEARKNFHGSDAKFAVSIGINSAQYSRIKNGETDQVISEANWIRLARRLNVSLKNAPKWVTAETPVYMFITAQLTMCQEQSLSALLCDLSDIGKTYSAMRYCEKHANAVYVDCSQVKSKQKLVRKIAREFGVGHTGRYADVYEDLVYYLKTIPNPLIVLDEAGDLNFDAFLEIKALWNATELCCGFYMMGADGLQEKMRRAIDGKKVGYTEIFSRFGKRYGHVIPVGSQAKEQLLNATAAQIIKANAGDDADVNRILKRTMGEDGRPSLRRIYTELSKAC